MWSNFDEPFVLSPKHAALFRTAAAVLSDLVGWEEGENAYGDMGIAVFDNLSQPQKQVALLTVARALLDPKAQPPTVTAALAGTVGAIYCQVECLIELEASLSEETGMRQMLLDAISETDYGSEVNGESGSHDEAIVPLSADRDDPDRWHELIQYLRSEVLADCDFEMDGNIADRNPDQAEALKTLLDIHPDYFVAVVEDPAPQRLAQIRSEIRDLLN